MDSIRSDKYQNYVKSSCILEKIYDNLNTYFNNKIPVNKPNNKIFMDKSNNRYNSLIDEDDEEIDEDDEEKYDTNEKNIVSNKEFIETLKKYVELPDTSSDELLEKLKNDIRIALEGINQFKDFKKFGEFAEFKENSKSKKIKNKTKHTNTPKDMMKRHNLSLTPIIKYIKIEGDGLTNLSGLGLLNDNLEITDIPTLYIKTDVLTLQKVDTKQTDKYITLSKKRIIAFEDTSYLLGCLLYHLSNAVFEDLVWTEIELNKKTGIVYDIGTRNRSVLWGTVAQPIGNKYMLFSIKIKFPNESDPTNSHHSTAPFIKSNDLQIVKHLCGGIYNTNSTNLSQMIKHLDYLEFHGLVMKKVHQLINQGYKIKSFPYESHCCPRLGEYKCEYDNISLKWNGGMTKKLECNVCRLDLCIGGCGRIYHGEGDCKNTFDEASEQFLQKVASDCSCPNELCKLPIEKGEGCNHMTCKCGVQFCYQCKKEFPKDTHGRYQISEHFIDNGVGTSGCRQFPGRQHAVAYPIDSSDEEDEPIRRRRNVVDDSSDEDDELDRAIEEHPRTVQEQLDRVAAENTVVAIRGAGGRL